MTWKFITNHGYVLALVAERGRITARQIALKLSITERTVQRVVEDLEREGYVKRFRMGRENAYEVDPNAEFTRINDTHGPIGDLLRVLNRHDEESPLNA